MTVTGNLRILHVLNHTMRLNGHVHAAIDLACEQALQGHAVSMASGGGDFDSLLAARSIRTARIDHRRQPLSLLRAALDLYRFARRWRADVIHAHMMTSAVLAWPIAKVLRIPLVTTVHNAFEKSAILMGLGTRVIAVSEAVARSMTARGLPRRRLFTVLNGTIGSARFTGRDRSPRRLSALSIVFVGGLHPRKGLPDLLHAFDIVHRESGMARLYVVGGGDHLESYKALAGSLACSDAVSFLGPQDEPFPLMAGADIFVLPSHADPAPLVLSEAREAGCAIVATAVDGIPELLEMGEAGILVPPRDPARMAEALLGLLTDKDELSAWRARSQLRIDKLRLDRVARDTMAVYRDALTSRPGRKPAVAGGER